MSDFCNTHVKDRTTAELLTKFLRPSTTVYTQTIIKAELLCRGVVQSPLVAPVRPSSEPSRADSTSKTLLDICRKFIDDNQIRCGELIYQCDHVAENALPFLEAVCNLVGYYHEPSSD